MKSLLSALALLASVTAAAVGGPGPLSAEALAYNCILKKFTITFGSVTGAIHPTGIPPGFIDNSSMLSFYDNTEVSSPCQETLYIKVNPSNPLFDPTLLHVLVITPKPDTTLEEVVCLYSIYATRLDPLASIVLSVNTLNFSLNLQFAIGYTFPGQTIIVDYNTYATSNTVVLNALALPAAYHSTIVAEILNAPFTGLIPALLPPATMAFKDYSNRVPESLVLLDELNKKIDRHCHIVCPKEEQLCRLRCYVKQCEVIRKIAVRCARPKKCKISKKCLVYKYFAFISNCLTVIPNICFKNNDNVAHKIVDACCKSEDPFNVFCAILARFYVSISIEAQSYVSIFHSLFETIVGFNVYCHPHKEFEKLYDLAAKDTDNVKAACPEESKLETEGEIGTVEGGSDSKDEEGKEDEQKGKEKKGGVGKYVWTIAIVVAVVAVVSITAFALY